jgi:hypothetical protein
MTHIGITLNRSGRFSTSTGKTLRGGISTGPPRNAGIRTPVHGDAATTLSRTAAWKIATT